MPIANMSTLGNYMTLDFVESSVSARKFTNLMEVEHPPNAEVGGAEAANLEGPRAEMRRQNRCGNCGELGHNRRACPRGADPEAGRALRQQQHEGTICRITKQLFLFILYRLFLRNEHGQRRFQ